MKQIIDFNSLHVTKKIPKRAAQVFKGNLSFISDNIHKLWAILSQ